MIESALPEVTVPMKCDVDDFPSWYYDVYSSEIKKEYSKLCESKNGNTAYRLVLENHEEITGKTFVITGTLVNYTRDEIKNLIESYDGKTSGSVSKKTDVVIVGSDPGSKYDKAVQLGVTIWTEDEFLDHLNNE